MTYETTGFLEKNKDTVEADLLALMSSSEIEFLQNLFSDTAAKFRKTSIGTQFKGQLARLMETLNRTSPHYVRCIKSNSLKRPLILEGRNCLLQLRSAPFCCCCCCCYCCCCCCCAGIWWVTLMGREVA